ncbi:helix-turn-helix transcriptional regulator [Cellulomonas sp. ATA003]|uniref:helix-turn-helix transcriptional regulator n=1 Tax=Cellulomonas sp. ATA003 TaxID=3073064 RepID=UPI002873A4A6|nr:helix-turn-helix transcriptional regulator [Cellulomonas sp. ATA003]WNB86553.1 helix-turn-helix transcriptional regulator [Cellulomonas sp. ATA003]
MSRGSPLLLRHLVTEEITSGRLSPTSGLWAWTGDPHLSPRLAALLQHEMGALAPAVRTVVDLVALGEPVGAATLLDLATADAVEEAEGRGLVRSAGGPAGPVVRLAHPLYGEVRRESMGGVRARRLRGLLAARLDGEADPLQRAVLLLDSDLAPDLDLFRRAAARALSFHDLPLAERLARAASAAGASTDDGSWDARLLHASILSWLSRGAEAETVLAELVTDAPSGELRARARVYRAGNLLWTLARADEARSVLHGALDAPDAGPARPAVEAMAAALDAALGDARAAVARGRAVLAHHPDDLDDLTRTLATVAVAAGAAVTGRTDLLDQVVRDGGAVRLPGAIPVFGLADWVLLGYRLAGDPVTGVETTRALLAASADLPSPARVMGLVLAGHAALATGHVREALTPLREAWAALEPSPHEFRFRCRALLATAAALAGEPAAARPLLDGLAAHRHPAYALLAPDDALAQAWGAAAEGAVTEAVRLALGAAGLARRQASPALEVQAWQAVTQLGGSADAVTRLTALVTEVSGPRARTALAHARAWAAADGDGLRAASGAWERWGDLVAAGDAAAQAAEVDRRHGRAGSAVAAAARAQRIADRSGARTPALATAARPLPLTAREREVVVLAARGLSNREIAGRLTVSVRTVEGHLYRAGHKLDISDRARFADLLGDG